MYNPLIDTIKEFNLKAEVFIHESRSKRIYVKVLKQGQKYTVTISKHAFNYSIEFVDLALKLTLHKVSKTKPQLTVEKRFKVLELIYLKTLVPNQKKVRLLKTDEITFFHHDIVSIYNKIKLEYFSGNLFYPTIEWSKSHSFRRLGYYDMRGNRIVVSKSLDHRLVPPFVIEYIVYHEYLHYLHPVKISGRKRQFHHKDFKTEEQAFLYYHEADKWLKSEYPRIIRYLKPS